MLEVLSSKDPVVGIARVGLEFDGGFDLRDCPYVIFTHEGVVGGSKFVMCFSGRVASGSGNMHWPVGYSWVTYKVGELQELVDLRCSAEVSRCGVFVDRRVGERMFK